MSTHGKKNGTNEFPSIRGFFQAKDKLIGLESFKYVTLTTIRGWSMDID